MQPSKCGQVSAGPSKCRPNAALCLLISPSGAPPVLPTTIQLVSACRGCSAGSRMAEPSPARGCALLLAGAWWADAALRQRSLTTPAGTADSLLCRRRPPPAPAATRMPARLSDRLAALPPSRHSRLPPPLLLLLLLACGAALAAAKKRHITQVRERAARRAACSSMAAQLADPFSSASLCPLCQQVTILFSWHLDIGFHSNGPEPGYDNVRRGSRRVLPPLLLPEAEESCAGARTPLLTSAFLRSFPPLLASSPPLPSSLSPSHRPSSAAITTSTTRRPHASRPRCGAAAAPSAPCS